MKTIKFRLLAVLIAIAGFMAAPVLADLGLQQLAAQGAPAVGQAVLTAAKAVYANNTDPVVIQNQLIAILNEAAATGNEQAIRYAIVAVMLAGGVENIELSKTAINNSAVFLNYESLTAVTVAAAEALMTATGGANGTSGGDDMGGGGGEKGGGGDRTLGGGSDKVFMQELVDPKNSFPPDFVNPDTHDVPATQI